MSRKKLCPTCKQPLPTQSGPKRICAACHSPIGARAKWFFMTEGESTVVVHRHCDNPESYGPKDEKKAINQVSLV